jgi:hypothetical protein
VRRTRKNVLERCKGTVQAGRSSVHGESMEAQAASPEVIWQGQITWGFQGSPKSGLVEWLKR